MVASICSAASLSIVAGINILHCINRQRVCRCTKRNTFLYSRGKEKVLQLSDYVHLKLTFNNFNTWHCFYLKYMMIALSKSEIRNDSLSSLSQESMPELSQTFFSLFPYHWFFKSHCKSLSGRCFSDLPIGLESQGQHNH